MYYFFGAGTNCCGAIKFWGRENIVAIVDNSPSKEGTELMKVPIINFETFLEQYDNEKIIITTTNLHFKAITAQLEDNNIYNYYECPTMIYGFLSAEKVIERAKLRDFEKVYLLKEEPIHEKICEAMRKSGLNHFVWIDKKEDIKNIDNAIFITTNKDESIDNIKTYCIVDDNVKWGEEQSKSLEKYKRKYAGESCMVIGNGPSLRGEDLNKIYDNNMMSFASNSIYKVYDKTKWRPDFHVFVDGIVFEEEKHKLTEESIFFMSSLFRDEREGLNIEYFSGFFENYYPGYPSFAEDVTKGVYRGRTVTYIMLQLAAYMGFSTIYLLGVDFSWGEDGRSSHFYTDTDEKYEARIRDNIKYKKEYKKEVEHAYISAKRYAETHNINIYNATRGGYLEVFERVDFDKIFDGSN